MGTCVLVRVDMMVIRGILFYLGISTVLFTTRQLHYIFQFATNSFYLLLISVSYVFIMKSSQIHAFSHLIFILQFYGLYSTLYISSRLIKNLSILYLQARLCCCNQETFSLQFFWGQHSFQLLSFTHHPYMMAPRQASPCLPQQFSFINV